MTEEEPAGFVWKTIRYSVYEGVATVLLDRPERGNSWTARMGVEYRRALGLADADPAVGAIVITGSGRQFCVGADTRAVAKNAEAGAYVERAERAATGSVELTDAPPPPSVVAGPADTAHGFLLTLSKPVIAAVNGAAAGIGFVLACFADVRIVAEDAKLTTATARLGLPAEFGVSWILPRLIGASRAAPILLGGDVITGRDAEAMGLAYRAVPADQVAKTADEYAHALIDRAAPASLRATKRQLWADLERSLAASELDAQALLRALVSGRDYADGVAALTARHPPNFGARYRATEATESTSTEQE